MRLVVLGLLAALPIGPAWAQSKRYPPEPVDKDQETAKKSKLWESATNPQRSPYNDLVKEAEEILRDKTAESGKEALAKLDEAVKLMPDDDRAYRLRGEAHMMMKDWPRCASDYQASLDKQRTDSDLKSGVDIRRRLGLCQARAGKLADAERTLAEAAASGGGTGEVWLRLGEVRIAMGKLDEAIVALEAASEQTDVSPPLVRFLLAGAYDRARRPAEATKAATEALAKDPELTTLRSTAVPLLGVGEPEYLMGLAYAVKDPSQPEHALLYYRRFLKLAPDSPWRRRADDNLRALKSAELPEYITRTIGNAQLDLLAARTPARKLMPQLRACLAKQPSLLFKIEVTKIGARSPPTAAAGRRSYLPAEGVTILPHANLDNVSKIELDTVTRCLEPIADKIKAGMPAVKEKDAYYKAQFFVVGP